MFDFQLAFFASFHLAASPVAAPRAPTDAIRDVVKDLTAQVRVAEVGGLEHDRGCGVVVGFDEDAITILTAKHVVQGALDDPDDLHVSVLFPGTERWVDAKVGKPLEPLDGICLFVPRSHAPYKGDPPCRNLPVSPPPASGGETWALGFDPSRSALDWRPCVFQDVVEQRLLFKADGIVGGYSGGPLVTPLGILGMTIQSGPHRNHDAVPIAILLQRVVEVGGRVSLSRSPVHEAFQNMESYGLVGAWEVHDEKGRARWASIRVTGRESEEVDLECVAASGRFQAKLVPSTDGATLKVPGREVDFGHYFGLGGGVYEFQVDPSVSMPGFVVLRSATGNVVLNLALPFRKCELFAARALASALLPTGKVNLSEAMRKTLHRDIKRFVAGNFPTFCVPLCEGLNLATVLPLGLHEHRPVRLVGELLLPDELLSGDQKAVDKAKRAWPAVRLLLLTGTAQTAELASAPVRWESHEMRLKEFVAPAGTIWLALSETQPHTIANHPLLVRALRIEYTE